MKLRGITHVIVMCALVMGILALPVHADRNATAFTLDLDWGTVVVTEERIETGNMYHSDYRLVGNLVSAEPMVDDGLFIMVMKGAILPDNPHSLPVGEGCCWGTAPGTFSITAPAAEGQPVSGWEGQIHLNPQTDQDKLPHVLTVYGRGQGYGIYEDLNIKFEWNLISGVFAAEVW